MEISIKEQTLLLLPQKAIYWREKKILLISDLHLGKITHFRKEGIAVPSDAVHENYKRLDEMIIDNHPKKIIFIGDLFHSIENEEWKLFEKWRSMHKEKEVELIVGNHDLYSLEAIKKFDLKIHDKEITVGPFILAHKPLKKIEGENYVISGHVHPVFKLRGKGNQRMKFPCFYFTNTQAILPSFGYFTGGYEIQPEENSRLIIIAENKVREV